mmetsp:Transcript_59924/g.95222  ORF Transcript_59924/g.95222 Transcript_59924/m.95222 type:complete len:81 (+) Transcript_59924:233-475(+)
MSPVVLAEVMLSAASHPATHFLVVPQPVLAVKFVAIRPMVFALDLVNVHEENSNISDDVLYPIKMPRIFPLAQCQRYQRS